jgi:hypothetical protein
MTTETTAPVLLSCQHCGRAGADVVQRQEWVGGRGYKWFVECFDWLACQRRREKGAA